MIYNKGIINILTGGKMEKEYKFIPCIEIRVSDKKLTMPDISFNSSEEVAGEFIKGEFKTLVDVAQERFILLCLNTKNKLVNYSIISQGSLNSSIVHPREVLKPAILSNAASVIFLHNHPSGDPEPSLDDIEITKRLSKAFEICGINVLDHIIIGDDWFSFKRKQML
jgi:DNA repair protein RadC